VVKKPPGRKALCDQVVEPDVAPKSHLRAELGRRGAGGDTLDRIETTDAIRVQEQLNR
jgi:hypothetical protein